jgi:uncharacterized protein with HEPN domain
MKPSRFLDYVIHMESAAKDACTFVEGLQKDDFLGDKRTQQAVIMSLIILGEAATKAMDLFPEAAQEFSTIPWRSMRGMRNRITHGYFDINLDIVWDTVENALPELLDQIKEIPRH